MESLKSCPSLGCILWNHPCVLRSQHYTINLQLCSFPSQEFFQHTAEAKHFEKTDPVSELSEHGIRPHRHLRFLSISVVTWFFKLQMNSVTLCLFTNFGFHVLLILDPLGWSLAPFLQDFFSFHFKDCCMEPFIGIFLCCSMHTVLWLEDSMMVRTIG